MRILFYLPAATAPWFTDNIAPLVRTALRSAEVHIIITPEWNGTGFTEETLAAACFDLLDKVNWHVLGGPDHPSFRTSPEDPDTLIAAVREIAPDYTFCRSADVTTPAGFPGKVFYLMEGEYAPSLQGSVPRGGRIVVSGPRFFDFGFFPELDAEERERLDRLIDPAWQSIAKLCALDDDRDAWLASVGLPSDRRIIAVPLQFQGGENVFTLVHGSEGTADRFIENILTQADDDWLLAVSTHPKDRRNAIEGPIARIAAMDPNRVRILDFPEEMVRGEGTQRLIQHCDALIVAESKSISLGAYFGKPILRLSHFAAADWVNAYTDFPAFRDALRSGGAAVADPAAFRTWYAYHFANNAFRASMTDLSELLDRADRPVGPDRWEPALATHDAPYTEAEQWRFDSPAPFLSPDGGERAPRLLFYLPAINKRWFADIVVPLLRTAVQSAEVHVLVAPYTKGNGITDDDLAGCYDLLDKVNWHVVEGVNQESFRANPEHPAELIAAVREIAPDYTFCRSADVTTPAEFPGKVVYLMEAEFTPTLQRSVPRGGRVMLSGPRFYDFGFFPDLDAEAREGLNRLVEPAWKSIADLCAQEADRNAFLASVGLPLDRRIIAVPLQYQEEENVFGQLLGSEGQADRFIERIVAGADDDWLLALSLHPIDRRSETKGPVHRIAEAYPDRVRIADFPRERIKGEATLRLVKHCDALIVSESKAISLGAYFGKPILRLSHYATAGWVHAYSDIATFREALRSGQAAVADPEAFRTWYAFHFANDAFHPARTSFAELLDRVDSPVNPSRWEPALANHDVRYAVAELERFPAAD